MDDSRALWVYLSGAGTLVMGLVLGARLLQPLPFRAPPVPLRQSAFQNGEYRYINPLLALNLPESKEFPNLRNGLRATIETAIEKYKADAVSIYFKDLNNSEWFCEGRDELYNPASMLKILTMIAYYKLAESDPAVLSTTLYYDGSFDRNAKVGLPSPVQIQPGEYTIEALIEHMIKHSDNNAAALLNDHANKTNTSILTQSYLDLGIDTINMTDDFITVSRYSLLLRVLFNATYLSRPMSEKALELLTNTDFADGLVKGIPANTTVAHKFGEFGLDDTDGNVIKRELHDCGIIYDKQQPYLLCVMTKGGRYADLSALIAGISTDVYNSEERRAQPW